MLNFQIAHNLVGRVHTGWIRNQFLFLLVTFLLPRSPVYETCPNHAPLLQVKHGKFFTAMCWEHTSHITNHMHIPTYLRDTNKAPTKTQLKQCLCLNSTTNPAVWFLGTTIQHSPTWPEVHIWSELLINNTFQLVFTEVSNWTVIFHIFKETNPSLCPGWPSKFLFNFISTLSYITPPAKMARGLFFYHHF